MFNPEIYLINPDFCVKLIQDNYVKMGWPGQNFGLNQVGLKQINFFALNHFYHLPKILALLE